MFCARYIHSGTYNFLLILSHFLSESEQMPRQKKICFVRQRLQGLASYGLCVCLHGLLQWFNAEIQASSTFGYLKTIYINDIKMDHFANVNGSFICVIQKQGYINKYYHIFAQMQS